MERSKKYFLDFLDGHGSVPVLFEPFLSFAHAETLIWRRGQHLWDTPHALIDTLAYLTERTQADMIFPDIRIYDTDTKRAVLHEISEFSKNSQLGVGVVCDSADASLCENTEGVDCLCVYGDAMADHLPLIRMDGTAEDAAARGDKAWFCPKQCEEYLSAYGDRLLILGGMGLETLIGGSPVGIYDRVSEIDKKFGNRWACGSGGALPNANYLELISLLGAYARIRG